jgi:hypothetical protein
MHAKSDLRVILKWVIACSDSVITDVMPQRKQTMILGAVLAFSAVACFASGTLADDRLANTAEKPIVSWSGSDSHVQKKQILRITTERDWINLWLKHTGERGRASGYDSWLNKSGIPSIDFSRHMVIAIFDGKSVNCAGLADATIQRAAKEMVFRFKFKSYGTVGDADTVSAFGLYVVPVSSKPITLQFPEPVPKGADPSGSWETYGRISAPK